MYSYSDIQDHVKLKASNQTASNFWSTTMMNLCIEQAYQFIATMHQWAALEKHGTINTVAGTEQYDYPTADTSLEKFQTDGIRMLLVGGVEYERQGFIGYQRVKLDNTANTDTKIFTEQSRKIFIYPVPTSIQAIDVYGYVIPKPLATDSDSFFTSFDPSGDQAIKILAYSYMLEKAGRKDLAMSYQQQAIGQQDADGQWIGGIIGMIWNKFGKNNQNVDPNIPQFDVPDMFAPNYYQSNNTYGRP